MEGAFIKFSLVDLQAGMVRQKVEVESLNEYLALTYPSPAAAKQAIKLSEARIFEFATALQESKMRQRRIII